MIFKSPTLREGLEEIDKIRNPYDIPLDAYILINDKLREPKKLDKTLENIISEEGDPPDVTLKISVEKHVEYKKVSKKLLIPAVFNGEIPTKEGTIPKIEGSVNFKILKSYMSLDEECEELSINGKVCNAVGFLSDKEGEYEIQKVGYIHSKLRDNEHLLYVPCLLCTYKGTLKVETQYIGDLKREGIISSRLFGTVSGNLKTNLRCYDFKYTCIIFSNSEYFFHCNHFSLSSEEVFPKGEVIGWGEGLWRYEIVFELPDGSKKRFDPKLVKKALKFE